MLCIAVPDPPSDWEQCFDIWKHVILHIVILGPVHVTKYCLDCVGANCCNDGSGCCSNCCKQLFPVCASETCIERSRYISSKHVHHFTLESMTKFELFYFWHGGGPISFGDMCGNFVCSWAYCLRKLVCCRRNLACCLHRSLEFGSESD